MPLYLVVQIHIEIWDQFEFAFDTNLTTIEDLDLHFDVRLD